MIILKYVLIPIRYKIVRYNSKEVTVMKYKHSKVTVKDINGKVIKQLDRKTSNKHIAIPMIDKYIEQYQYRYILKYLLG